MSVINNRNEQGMTLVELMVAGAIVAVMMIGVFNVFLGQKRLYMATDLTAIAQDNARTAMDTLQREILKAGLGVDPSLSFFFVNIDTFTSSTAQTFTPDSLGGPDTLQFLARENNPLPGAMETNCPPHPIMPSEILEDRAQHFYWRITGASSTNGINLNVCPGFQLRAGTILLAMCGNGDTYSYMRYLGPNVGTPIPHPGGAVTLPINDLFVFYSVTERSYPATTIGFGQQPELNLDKDCFDSANSELFRVNFYKFYVYCPNWLGNGECDPNSIPYLMLDTGTDINDNGTYINDVGDHIPIAEGIEDMQVVYSLFNGSIYGCNGCAQAQDVLFTNGGAVSPAYCDSVTYYNTNEDTTCRTGGAPTGNTNSDRKQNFIGNTVTVRVSIVARTSREIDEGSFANRPALENRPAAVTFERMPRVVLTDTLSVVNTLATQSFAFANLGEE